MTNQHEKINYLEFPVTDMQGSKDFFSSAFGWKFTDYGPEYASFSKEVGIDGGFYYGDKKATTESGSVLVVLYSRDLESTLSNVIEAGGTVVKPVFDFPGGRRFHFTDPSGNEFAVWSDRGISE